jgi:iron complex outermembrane receptor protein
LTCGVAATLLFSSSLQAAPATRIEEVLVTARKREENAQTVPVSMAVFTEDEITARSIESLSDLALTTPNFLYGQKTQSGSSAGQIYIRGIGQQDNLSTFNPGVGLYVDGVYLGRAQANDLETADIERLEVLYGPQGTLFGKNTNGGAVNIVTVRPDVSALTPNGLLDVTTGNFDRFTAHSRVNFPLRSDAVALQLSASHRQQSGYSRRLDGDEQADVDRTSGRMQLLIKPGNAFEAFVSLDGTTFDEHTSAFRLVDVRTASTIPTLYASSTPFRYDDRWLTDNDFRYNGTGPNKNSGSVWGASVSLTATSGWGTLKSITAYRELSVRNEFDPDGSPLAILDIFNTVDQHQVSQELQLSGRTAGQRVQWVSGVYFFDESVQENQPANVALEFFNGGANFDPRLHVVNDNYAAYGQATILVTERLRATAGGRVGYDAAEVERAYVGYPNAVALQPFTRRSANWTSFLPRIGLDYQWTPELMTYLSVAKGAKSGGFNGRAGSVAEFNRFDAENVWTYEVGVRSDWLDKRLRVNATAFYSVYSDFQILLNSSVTDASTGAPVPFSFVGNMPEATIKGGELSVTAAPLAGLMVSAAAGVADGKYKRIIAGAPVTHDSEFVDTPKVTVTASAEYVLPIGIDYSVRTRMDYVHKTTTQFDYGNSALVAQRPYGLLNARATLDCNAVNLSLFIFGTNLSDEHYAIGGLDDGVGGSLGEVVQQMGAPREYGIGAQYRF